MIRTGFRPQEEEEETITRDPTSHPLLDLVATATQVVEVTLEASNFIVQVVVDREEEEAVAG